MAELHLPKARGSLQLCMHHLPPFIQRKRAHYLKKDILCNLRRKGAPEVLSMSSRNMKCHLQGKMAIDKLPVKLANKHCWHGTSPPQYYIWNNRNIKSKTKSLFDEKWVENGILLVQQLVTAEGQLPMTQQEHRGWPGL